MRIAFAGKSGSGKTTIVKNLIENYGGIELNFADPLKKITTFIQDTCHFPHEKDRKLLQWIGTEWGRNKDEAIWVRLLEEELEKNKDHVNIFIGDLRFPNEKKMLKRHGFMCVYISIGDEIVHDIRDEHISERAFKHDEEWDLVLQKGNIQDMVSKINKII